MVVGAGPRQRPIGRRGYGLIPTSSRARDLRGSAPLPVESSFLGQAYSFPLVFRSYTGLHLLWGEPTFQSVLLASLAAAIPSFLVFGL